MSKIYTKDNPLKDLKYLIRIFWKEKLMLITLAIILMSVGGIYAYKQPSLYSFSTTIKKTQASVFNKYKVINEILGRNKKNVLFTIDNKSIFEKFFYTANNYSKKISFIENDLLINSQIDGLNDQSKQRMLFDIARSFQIKDYTKLESATASFMWHDVNEGLLLFEKLIKKTAETVKENIITEVKQSSKMINSMSEKKLKDLKNKKENILELEKTKIERELLILEEQYSIAKDLGIEGSIVNIRTSPYYIKDYMRGYKAISKEIEFLKKRSNEDTIKRSIEYIKINREMYDLKNDKDQNILIESINVLETDKSDDWVNFNILDANIVKISPEPHKYAFFGLILGLVLGVLFVIIRDLIRRLRLIK